METAIPAIIIIALLLLTSVTLAEQVLSSHEDAAESWLEMEERQLDRSRTQISILDAYAPSDTQVDVTVRNDGQEKLADFERWDVILRADSFAEWYPYTTTLSTSDTWTASISEVVEPSILNPGEQMTVRIELSEGVGSDNLVVVTTPNGLSASHVFTY